MFNILQFIKTFLIRFLVVKKGRRDKRWKNFVFEFWQNWLRKSTNENKETVLRYDQVRVITTPSLVNIIRRRLSRKRRSTISGPLYSIKSRLSPLWHYQVRIYLVGEFFCGNLKKPFIKSNSLWEICRTITIRKPIHF